MEGKSAILTTPSGRVNHSNSNNRRSMRCLGAKSCPHKKSLSLNLNYYSKVTGSIFQLFDTISQLISIWSLHPWQAYVTSIDLNERTRNKNHRIIELEMAIHAI
ncbi:UNVERIFIED_CONTAM: hypothetical protein K2H54_069695 [Gekko kuhli]